MKKIENEDLEKEIINLYNQSLSIRKISKLINRSTSFVSRILQDKKLYKYEKGESTVVKRSFELTDDSLQWVAQCKITKEIFNDYKNQCGILTRHILKNNPHFKEPTGFKKRQQEKKTGKFWFEDFFDIITIPKKIVEKKKCPYCDWSTIDLNNKSGAFTSHLKDFHNKNIFEYTQEYPKEIKLFKTFFEKLNNHLNIINNKENYIECKLCHKKMRKISNTHLLNKHNISLEDYRIRFGITTSTNTFDKIKNNYNIFLKNHPNTFTSKAQMEISDFIKSSGFDTEHNNKKLLNGVELDIVIKNTNICIEYNGLLYHSEKFGKKDKNFHINKTLLANDKKLILIHIFEDEWRDKKEIVKSKILHLLKKTQFKVHARKCIIKPVQQPEKESFLNSNHILGNCLSTINYGAYYNNELIAIMTFNNNRSMTSHKKNSTDYELTRFAIKLNYNVCGIAKRFLKQFINDYKPEKIISFAERTWTNNDKDNIYTQMGFNMTKVIKPDYKYFSKKLHSPIKIHKFNFGKSALSRKFPNIFDENKTEWEIMQEAGYDRIWDCGKFRYELECTNQRNS